MTNEASMTAEARWQALMLDVSAWFESPQGRLLLESEQRLLTHELKQLFGSYLVHYGPQSNIGLEAPTIKRSVRIGPPLPGVEILCEECSWPIGEHAADIVVVQHGLDFSLSPHALLREAARSVRPGGHLLVLGINPWSSWGVSHLLSRRVFRQARCIRPSRVGDWLSLLGFALEKRRFGCYCPPLSSAQWSARLTWMERMGQRLQAPYGGVYLLVARKMMMGLRPLRESRRESMGQLLPMPVAKVSRREAEQ